MLNKTPFRKVSGNLKLLWFALGLVSVSGYAVEPSSITATGLINQTSGADRSNWDLVPHNAYSFTLTEHIFPSLLISPGDQRPTPLRYRENPVAVERHVVEDPITGRPMSFQDFLNRRMHNDGLLVSIAGEVVHESYRNGMDRHTRHILMSASKSLVGLTAQIAIQKNLFNANDLVITYVPELADKPAWQDVQVRHVMDMTDGIAFNEDYNDPSSDVRVQDRSTGWRPWQNGDPKGMRAYVSQNLDKKAHPTGTHFNYSSVQTDILAMVIEGASNKPWADFFEEFFYKRLGAERAATVGTDGYGHPIVQGTISLTLPDFLRLAHLMLAKGKSDSGEQIIDPAFFADLVQGHPDLNRAFGNFSAGHDRDYYRSQIWVTDAASEIIMLRGVHGQFAYLDLKKQLAIVALGSHPQPIIEYEQQYLNVLLGIFATGLD